MLVIAVVVMLVVLVAKLLSDGTQPANMDAVQSIENEHTVQTNTDNETADSVSGITTTQTGANGNIDFATLTAKGKPIVGWLYGAGTTIDGPVVQGEDNEFYMAHNADGKKNKNGALYLDCRNSTAFADGQIMIYGNPMQDGAMFGALGSYRDPDYYAQHPFLILYTPEKSYRIDVFAAHTASPAMGNYPIWFESDTARDAYLNEVRTKSLIQSDMVIAQNATLISLVTSSDFDAGDDARFVVHGVLTEK